MEFSPSNTSSAGIKRPVHKWDGIHKATMDIEHLDDSLQTTVPDIPILMPTEVETLVQELENVPIPEIGSKFWMKQHIRIEKLNLQAHQHARSNSEEIDLSTSKERIGKEELNAAVFCFVS